MKQFVLYLKYVAAVFLLIFLGFYRDFFFVNLNYQLSAAHCKINPLCKGFPFNIPPSLIWMQNFSYEQLYYSKYLFTAISIVLFFLSTLYAVKIFFIEKKYLKWVLYAYLLVTFACGIIFLIFNWTIGFNNTYAIIRKVIDITESPLMAMIIIPVIYFHKKLAYQNKKY